MVKRDAIFLQQLYATHGSLEGAAAGARDAVGIMESLGVPSACCALYAAILYSATGNCDWVRGWLSNCALSIS
jgi:hypothetical protein